MTPPPPPFSRPPPRPPLAQPAQMLDQGGTNNIAGMTMVANSIGQTSPTRPVDSRQMSKWSLELQTLGDIHDAAVLEDARIQAHAQAQAQARAWSKAREDQAADAEAAAMAAAAAEKACRDLEDAHMSSWRRHDDARPVRAQLLSQGTGMGYPQQQVLSACG